MLESYTIVSTLRYHLPFAVGPEELVMTRTLSIGCSREQEEAAVIELSKEVQQKIDSNPNWIFLDWALKTVAD